MESNGSLATPNDQSLGVRLVGGIIHLKEGQRIISATEQGAWPIQMPAPRSRALAMCGRSDQVLNHRNASPLRQNRYRATVGHYSDHILPAETGPMCGGLMLPMSRLARHGTGMLSGRRAPIGPSMATDCRCRIDLPEGARRSR